jgi:hypothetical protein
MAYRKPCHGTEPGVDVASGLKNSVRNTFSTRASTEKVGWLSAVSEPHQPREAPLLRFGTHMDLPSLHPLRTDQRGGLA